MGLVSESTFLEKVNRLKGEISTFCRQSSRSIEEVEILPVTKVHPVDAWYYVQKSELKSVGENWVQEAQEKSQRYENDKLLYKELIGHLQSNKAKLAVEIFDRIQSVDTIKLAQRISKAAEANNKTIAILLQVNTDLDEAKSGMAPKDFFDNLAIIQELPYLQIDGLMTIGRMTSDFDEQRRTFASLRELAEKGRLASGLSLKTLSMGMSGDIRAAILEGSTQVRVGTALFGSRN